MLLFSLDDASDDALVNNSVFFLFCIGDFMLLFGLDEGQL
jgi:hypothetical protein